MGRKDVSSRNSRRKINLVFDEQKRREFLSGFHKRKLQRKKAAKEKFENDLKEEQKRLKHEARESYKKLVTSHKPIPELEDLLAEEYEDDDVNVKILELSSYAIANRNNWIGANQLKYESDTESATAVEEKQQREESRVPGMELKETKTEQVESDKQSFASERDLKKSLKKQATENVKNSKIFQRKNKMERQKQKKKSFKQNKLKIKLQEKQKKKRRM